MTPKSPQQEVNIVVGAKKKKQKRLLWLGLAALGGALVGSAYHFQPFNIMNGLQRPFERASLKSIRPND